MSAAITAQPRNQTYRALSRFFRTPKGYLLLVLLGLIAMAIPTEGIDRVGPGILVATTVAGIADLLIVRERRGEWSFPSGAILTALIIAMLLSPIEPLYVVAGTSGLAIMSKYLFRTRLANVFNPAAIAIVASSLIYGSVQSWWGSLPDLSPLALILVLGAGVFVANHVNKMPMALTFLAVYFALFTAIAYLVDPAAVAEIYRVPDLNAALFFTFFMLDDPPTSPVRYPDQVRFGIIVAVASWALFLALGVVWFLPGGLLIGNLWEAMRRRSTSARPVTGTA